MSTATTEQEKRDKIRAMVNDIRDAMFVSHAPDGGLHGRPMATAEVEEGWERIWFATRRDSGKVEEIRDDAHVFLGYAKGAEWVSISGKARVVRDQNKAAELWSPLWKNWFRGPDDPEMLLIEVSPEHAEYWDNGSRIFALAKMAAAAVTGKHFETGEHQSVTFS